MKTIRTAMNKNNNIKGVIFKVTDETIEVTIGYYVVIKSYPGVKAGEIINCYNKWENKWGFSITNTISEEVLKDTTYFEKVIKTYIIHKNNCFVNYDDKNHKVDEIVNIGDERLEVYFNHKGDTCKKLISPRCIIDGILFNSEEATYVYFMTSEFMVNKLEKTHKKVELLKKVGNYFYTQEHCENFIEDVKKILANK